MATKQFKVYAFTNDVSADGFDSEDIGTVALDTDSLLITHHAGVALRELGYEIVGLYAEELPGAEDGIVIELADMSTGAPVFHFVEIAEVANA